MDHGGGDFGDRRAGVGWQKQDGRAAEATRPFVVSRVLEWLDVRGLQALRPASDFEFDRLPFIERLVALRLNGGEVDENVLAALALDEPKALAGVEPLYCSLFFHGTSFSFFKLFDASRPIPRSPQS